MSGESKEQLLSPNTGVRYDPERFARGKMACPSCSHLFHQPVETCPKCGFSGFQAVEKFQFQAPPLESVIDGAQSMTDEERAEVMEAMMRWRKRLPQIRFYTCLVALEEEVSLQEFAFWLFNAAQAEEQGDQAKQFGVLMVVDVKVKRITTTVGYGVEPLLTDADWSDIAMECRDEFARERYGSGIVRFLDKAGRRLMARGFEIEQELSR